VERVISQIANRGGRRLKLRYRGTAKNNAWLTRRTAGLNLRNLLAVDSLVRQESGFWRPRPSDKAIRRPDRRRRRPRRPPTARRDALSRPGPLCHTADRSSCRTAHQFRTSASVPEPSLFSALLGNFYDRFLDHGRFCPGDHRATLRAQG
jgi:hypothetical protein